jgi:hypothetical protein
MIRLFSSEKTDKKDGRLLMTCCTWNLKSGNRVYQILETLIFVLDSCERSRLYHHLWTKCQGNNFLEGLQRSLEHAVVARRGVAPDPSTR